MTASNIFQIELLEENEDDAHLKFNDLLLLALEGGTQRREVYTVTGDVTVTDLQFNERFFHHCTGSPASDYAIRVPIRERFFVVYNETPKTCTVETLATSTAKNFVDLEPLTGRSFYSNGEDVYPVSGSFGNVPYDIPFWFGGEPADGVLMSRIIIPRAVHVPINAPGSLAEAGVPPNSTGDIQVDIDLNGGNIGRIIFDGGLSTGVFDTPVAQNWVAGDKLEFIAPSPKDTAFGDISVTIVAQRVAF